MSRAAPELPDDLTHATTPEVRRFKVDLGNFLDRSVQFSVISLFVISLGVILYLGQYVFAPLLAGILVGFTLGPLSSRLERIGIRPIISALMIVISLFVLIVGVFYALAIPLESWSARLPQVGKQLTTHWENIRKPIEKLKEVEEEVAKAGTKSPRALEVTIKQEGVVSNVISSAPDVVARMVMFIVTLYFFLATRTSVKRSIIRFCPAQTTKLKVARIIRDTEAYLAGYIGTIAVINLAFGIVVGVAMYLIGLPQPYAWGLLAGVLNFAVFIGPIVMTFILLGVGLATFPGSLLAIVPPATFVVLNLIEGQLVTPAVLGRRLTLNPLVVFATIAFWLWLWGPIGAFLAVPLLIIVTMTLYHIMPGIAPKSEQMPTASGWPGRQSSTNL